MDPLPIDRHLPEITGRLLGSGAAVLVAPPGAGKTTRVPPALLEALGGRGAIVLLQPRRIAARAAAARMAQERGWTLGREVGYRVRFESRAGRDTRILVVTEGILTRRLQGDPFLDGVAAVILDEFHERSLHLDFALAALREVRAAARPDLKLLLMSATLDPAPLARFLGEAPVVQVEGRAHRVEVRYLDRPGRPPPAELAAATLREVWDEGRGHALVFLAGISEIRAAARELDGFARGRGAAIAPLHGGLSLEEQDAALRPSAGRKIVLSTNIAETSLTIEGVDLVIDSGRARVLRHDPRYGTDRLEVSRISKRSAEQRAGRAGRIGPGLVVRLWTRAEQEDLPEEELPEIRRVDLAATVLELRAWGVSAPERFGWFEAPDPAALSRAEDLLVALGAVAGRGGPVTEVGRSMLAIPAHPRLSRIVAAAHAAGKLREGAALAALLAERDLLPLPLGSPRPASARDRGAGPSDLLLRLDLLEEAERAQFRRERLSVLGIDASAARAAARARDAFLRSAREELGPEPAPPRSPRGAPPGGDAALLRLVLLGYPDRVARRRSRASDRARMVGGRGLVLARESVVRDAEHFVAVEVEEAGRGERAEALVRIASGVRREWLEELYPSEVHERVETFFDEQAGKVRSTATLSYRDLSLEEPRERRPDPELASRAFAEALRGRAEEICLADEEARAWIARVRSLREWMPELGLPTYDARDLAAAVVAAAEGAASIAEIKARGLGEVLRAALPHDELRAVDRHAPPAVRVPSGRVVPLAYEPGRPPVLAVRLQEMFGLGETPRVAAGRVPVLLHLLGPNSRPVQITQDLRSFWERTYLQVRKDLRARYPRHAWPEDPWSAAPEARPRRRG